MGLEFSKGTWSKGINVGFIRLLTVWEIVKRVEQIEKAA